jgi:N-methylhydantoinase A/oxoprolinase/acetone carboxylase beta subunit
MSDKEYQMACDAGGTMTDIILIDPEGDFVIGKAATTPRDESVGLWESLGDAAGYLGVDWEKDSKKMCPRFSIATYTGTTMLNTLLNRAGSKVGMLITKGFEDTLETEQGKSAVSGYRISEIFHIAYRRHNVPLIPKRLIRGITERIDLLGKEVIPVYEHEVTQAVEELLDENIEVLVISFLQSHKNSGHELQAAEVAAGVMRKRGREIPIVLGSRTAPAPRESSRTNAAVIQAYAVEPVKRHLFAIEGKLKGDGYKHDLLTVLSYGGVCNIRYERMFETLMSGPVGGVMGAQYFGGIVGEGNIVCTDMGGTSFDVGRITNGMVSIIREPEVQRMFVNLPMVEQRSIGAGTGTYIRIDPVTTRMMLGPESAGGDPGPVSYDMGNEIPTIGDCDLVLGVLNPDYYLGGKKKLNKDHAFKNLKEQVADKLGMTVYDAAEGAVNLLNAMMREHLKTTALVGYEPKDYLLLAFGGAGPMHLVGYGQADTWKGIATVPFAAAFSAWGCAAMDYAHRFHKGAAFVVPYKADAGTKIRVAQGLNAVWAELEEIAVEELAKEGITKEQIKFTPIAYMRYYGMLDDVEVPSPARRIERVEDMDRLIADFDRLFAITYTLLGRTPEAGYHIAEVAVIATAPTMKPVLRKHKLVGKDEIPQKAIKSRREVYYKGKWQEAGVYEMEELLPGNEISGIAVVEAPNTTLFVPTEWDCYLDGWRAFWLKRKEGK